MSKLNSVQPPIEALRSRLERALETGTLREIERAVIELRLARHGSVPKTAASLGTSLPTLYKKVRCYQMDAVRRDAEDRRAATAQAGPA